MTVKLHVFHRTPTLSVWGGKINTCLTYRVNYAGAWSALFSWPSLETKKIYKCCEWRHAVYWMKWQSQQWSHWLLISQANNKGGRWLDRSQNKQKEEAIGSTKQQHRRCPVCLRNWVQHTWSHLQEDNKRVLRRGACGTCGTSLKKKKKKVRGDTHF